MAQKLSGRSELLLPDGTVTPVRAQDGSLQLSAEEWARCRSMLLERVGHQVGARIAQDSARAAAFGSTQGERERTISLRELLGVADKAK